MHKIFLLILMCKSVLAEDEESDAKYIDLLPEEEKQEFLNRIARRILEGITTNDTPNESHAEIPDDQLDAQDAFVQEILKEESDNLKNDRVVSNRDSVNEKSEFGAESDQNSYNKEEHFDLTLREGRRKKRTNGDNKYNKETTTETSYDIIPVQTIYDQIENDAVKFDNKAAITLEADQKENAEEEIPLIESGISSDLVFPQNIFITESPNGPDKNESLKTTEIIDFEPNINENYTFQDYNINNENITLLPDSVSQEATYSTTNGEITWGFKQKIYESESEDKEEDQKEGTSTLNNSKINVNSQTESIKAFSSSNDVTETSKDEASTITAIINVTNSYSHKSNGSYLRSMTKFDEYEYLQTERSVTVVSKKLSNDISTSAIETVPINKTLSDVKIDSQIENLSTKIKNLSAYKLDIKTSESPAHLTSVKSNTVNIMNQGKSDENKTILRERDYYEVSQIGDNEPLHNINDDLNKVKVYKVYEVDANQPHFMSTDKSKQYNHPLYVPVYNYAPENAYFSTYNKLGPNIEDNDYIDSQERKTDEDANQSNLINTRNRFSAYNNKKIENDHKTIRNTKQTYKEQNAKRYEFIKPVTQNLVSQDIYYNPYDYADSNYYFGRILRRGKKINNEVYKSSITKNTTSTKYFPDSNEKDHPISSIHKSDTVKDHVRAIRRILYLQKLFGYVPQATDYIGRKANQYYHIGSTSITPKHNNIAIDYYFGRADSNENVKTNQDFRWNKPQLNIVPLTPNPLSFENKPEKLHLEMGSSEAKLSSATESRSQEIGELPFEKLFDSMLYVLKDKIKDESDSLLHYNWLKTTVDIQAAIRKLMDLIDQIKNGELVHPKDIELIKYTIYLFKSSQIALNKETKSTVLNKTNKQINAPRAKKRVMKFPKIIKERKFNEPIKRWKEYAALLLRDDKKSDFNSLSERKLILFNDFEDFLESLLININDLHDAIQHISVITEYKNQNWFQDLKVIYLANGSEKSLAQTILHLSLSRFLDLIEESATLGVEDDFRSFVKKNRDFVKRSTEECGFLLNVLEEMRRINALEP
ncbi:jg4893 [Pararge aegeria aegeria]|uniref:Jg4893 protein n=1 Tax=Pararge aegeria aegeria TaxID=348720 RepID=A0A8S4RJ38_9NEOP|nr:jg4893 [Pararge aegeria aegeria]